LFVIPEGNLRFLFVIPEGNLRFLFVIPEGNLRFAGCGTAFEGLVQTFLR
jgi:hypothetical protein